MGGLLLGQMLTLENMIMITEEEMKADSLLETGTCPTAEARYFNHVQGQGCQPNREEHMHWRWS